MRKIADKVTISFAILIILTGTVIVPTIGGNIFTIETCISSSDTLYVGGSGPGNYSNIQCAIDNASNGDTVFVYNGLYYENLVVDKPIFLKGQNRESTIINGGNTGDIPCINIIADSVSVEGFFVQWADWEYHEPGIKISSNYVIIKNNNISIHDKGLILHSSAKYCIITNNIISHNHEGIYIWPTGSDENVIENNYVVKNNFGFKIFSSNANIIRNNTISDNNWYGILMKSSKFNSISKNTIENNSRGISVDSSSTNNSFYHNNFISNSYQVIDTGLNRWYMDYPCGGNYWSDYNGTDANDDGFGDQPYRVPGRKNSIDAYPFIRKNQWGENPLQALFSGPKEGFINQQLQFNVNVSGGMPPYAFHWDFGDKQTANTQNPLHIYENAGDYKINLTVEDAYFNEMHEVVEITIYDEDNIPPKISIISPKPGFYVNNKLIFAGDLPLSFVIGGIAVKVQATDYESRIVEMNINIEDILSESINGNNYTYNWSKSKRGFYVVCVEAIDLAENSATDEIFVIKI